jgi:ankyrin repeat protein
VITATHRRDLVMVKLLLAGGADPTRPDSSGRSARDYARLDGQDQILSAFDAAAKNKPALDPAKPSYGPSF